MTSPSAAAPTDGNIILTGFMATGKSTVGRLLAQRLDRRFVDTDAVIEADHGPIPDIFAQHGEEAFRRLERDVAADLAERRGLVIATGGRLLLDAENARLLMATGRAFCLTATPAEIVDRVKAQQASDGVERPMLDGNPDQNVRALLDERRDGYGRFPQVSTSNRSLDNIVDELMLLITETEEDDT